MNELETRTIGKVMRRVVPFLILCYFVAYLDRVNVGFAKLQMNSARWNSARPAMRWARGFSSSRTSCWRFRRTWR